MSGLAFILWLFSQTLLLLTNNIYTRKFTYHRALFGVLDHLFFK
jgi:hypothetical protein